MTLRERFDSKWIPEPFSGCWLWTGATIKGYGAIKVEGKQVKAPRASWKLHRGEIPEGLWALHKCDTPLCVNPDHLFLGTAKDNTQDSIRKNRKPIGVDHGRAKLTEEEVRFIRTSPLILKKLAERFGMAISTIASIRNGESWRHVRA